MTDFSLIRGAQRGPFAAGSENHSDLTGCGCVLQMSWWCLPLSTTFGAFRAMRNWSHHFHLRFDREWEITGRELKKKKKEYYRYWRTWNSYRSLGRRGGICVIWQEEKEVRKLKLGGCHVELFVMICRLLPCRSGSADLSFGVNCFSHVGVSPDLNWPINQSVPWLSYVLLSSHYLNFFFILYWKDRRADPG